MNRLVLLAGFLLFSIDRGAYSEESIQAMGVLKLELGGGVTMELLPIKPGTFQMGSPDSEENRDKNEVLHEVTLTQPFYMSKFPVTQEQYEAVLKTNPSRWKSPKNPVENVSWNDAAVFCQKLQTLAAAELPGKMEVQLPTEAQWEYACRAGTQTPFYSGSSEKDLAAVGWYTKNCDAKTHPVGEKKPNAWGLFDMHGNVWQFCQDWKGDYPNGPQTDPRGSTDGERRILRGGSWTDVAYNCRSACRDNVEPDKRRVFFGIRIVVAAAPPKAK